MARYRLLALVSLFLCLCLSPALAHRDPCHRWHSCPSDRGTYTCGDTRRCSQYPNNTYCLNRQPRTANPPAPPSADPQPAPARQEQFSGKVVGVTDGDTLSVLRDGKAVKMDQRGHINRNLRL